MRALDAAKAAGARYADVRFTTTRRRSFGLRDTPTAESETHAVGVRVLGQYTWGFASHSDWTPDVIAQLGRKATEIARIKRWPWVSPIELDDSLSAPVGNWVMPIQRDPFTVPVEETAALLNRVFHHVTARPNWVMDLSLTFERQERTFASTEGAYTTQTVYTSLGGVPHQLEIPPSHITIAASKKQMQDGLGYRLPFVTPTGAGYEALENANVLDLLPQWMETAQELAFAKNFEKLGAYDIVFDGAAMAEIVNETLGTALEYDRAIGLEANAGETSYLAPPLEILGTPHAPTTVTITGDRTLPQGVATIKWDDEGIVSRPFPLIEDGAVVNYASSREFAEELTPWYQRQHMPARSNGCMASEYALTVPIVSTPNLVLHPAAKDTSLEALLAGIEDGLLVCGGGVQMDSRRSSGRGGRNAYVYEIKHGKRAMPVQHAMYYINSRQVWKNLVALGGASTMMTRGLIRSKGEPNQTIAHSVQAVAAHVGKIQVVNRDRL